MSQSEEAMAKMNFFFVKIMAKNTWIYDLVSE